MTTFSFNFSGTVELDENAIWPQSYQDRKPENPTAADVAAFIESEGGNMVGWIRDWNMPVQVAVDGQEIKLY